MHCAVCSADGEMLVVNLLHIWMIAQVLQQYSQRWEDQTPRVLLFHSRWLRTLKDKHTHFHMPAIIAQIGLILAHIPESTPLLCQLLLHRCVTTVDSATERTTTELTDLTLGFGLFHSGRFGRRSCTQRDKPPVAHAGLSRVKASRIKWLQSNQPEKSEQESSKIILSSGFRSAGTAI